MTGGGAPAYGAGAGAAGTPLPPLPPLPGFSDQQATRGPQFAGEAGRGEPLDEALDIVEASPDGAVVLGWRAVEATYMRVLRAAGHPETLLPVPRAAAALIRLGLSRSVVDLMLRLAQLRNEVVHGRAAVTPVPAMDFLSSCEILLNAIGALRPGGEAPGVGRGQKPSTRPE